MLSSKVASFTRPVTRTFRSASALNMKVGDKLPGVDLFEGSPANKVNAGSLFAGKKGILFAIPGAFTPGCSKTHVPGYVENFDAIKAKGVDVIACVSINDPFVMEAFGKSQGADGKVLMLADTAGEFTKALGMEQDLSAALGNVRSKRYSAVIEDGVIKAVNIEPDGKGLTCSLAPAILANL